MDLQEILNKVARGEELSNDEFSALRSEQERLDDALEIQNGRQRGVGFDVMRSIASGAGLAIVVGHTRNAAGAFAGEPISQSEYFWNSDLANKIKAHCDRLGVDCKIFFRDLIGISGAYRQVASWGAACVVELHFNAFNGNANGTETLFDKDRNSGSRPWAERLQRSMLDTLGLRDRGLVECDRGDRGFASVSAIDVPTALIEPFFGDNFSDAQIAQANKDDLARAIAKAAQAQLAVS